MRRLKAIHSILLSALFTGVVAAQARTVEVGADDGFERNHIAHQLGVPLSAIGNLRNLLEEATELTLESQLDPGWSSIGNLAPLWRRVHPRQAMPALDKLIDKLKTTARETPDAATYHWCASTARSLVQSLDPEDPPMEAYLEDWPERPDLLGPANGPSWINRELHQRKIRRASIENPSRTLEIVRNASLQVPASLLLDLAGRLLMEGRGKEAAQLVQERIDDLLGAPLTQNASLEFTSMLETLAEAYPDLLLPALRTFVSRGGELASPGSVGLWMETSLGSAQLDPSETRIYWLLRNNLRRPETLLRILDAFPELKKKVDRLGGFDQSLEAHFSKSAGRPAPGVEPSEPVVPGFSYRWGEAADQPSDVRRQLEAAFPGGLNWNLVYLVRSHCVDDPAFSRITLELMAHRTSQIPELGTRQNWLAELVAAYRFCEGGAPDSLIEEGFQLLEEVRRDPPMIAESVTCKPWENPVLETELIKELSRRDVETASKFVKGITEPNRRLDGYIALIEGRFQK